MPYAISADDYVLIAHENVIYFEKMNQSITLPEPMQQIYASKHNAKGNLPIALKREHFKDVLFFHADFDVKDFEDKKIDIPLKLK